MFSRLYGLIMNYSNLKENQVIITTKKKVSYHHIPSDWRIIAVLRDGKVLAQSLTGNVQKVFERNYAFGV